MNTIPAHALPVDQEVRYVYNVSKHLTSYTLLRFKQQAFHITLDIIALVMKGKCIPQLKLCLCRTMLTTKNLHSILRLHDQNSLRKRSETN